MAARPIRNKLIPFKVLAMLLYADAPWLVRDVDNFIDVLTGPLARVLHISVGRLNEHLTYLVEMGYIQLVHRSVGVRVFRVNPPPRMRYLSEGTLSARLPSDEQEAPQSSPGCVQCSSGSCTPTPTPEAL